MAKILTKHFQYAGTDDFDTVLDEQINNFLEEENIDESRLIDIKYSGHDALGVNTYSALIIYRA